MAGLPQGPGCASRGDQDGMGGCVLLHLLRQQAPRSRAKNSKEDKQDIGYEQSKLPSKPNGCRAVAEALGWTRNEPDAHDVTAAAKAHELPGRP